MKNKIAANQVLKRFSSQNRKEDATNLAVTAAQIFEFTPMKGSAKRKCLCCGEFYPPDHRNLRHQRYCSKPACRKESKAQSQRRWLQSPERPGIPVR